MAADIDTGMDKQEMKRLLMRSKDEPVSCAFGQGDDNTVALLMLDKVKQPKAVEKDLSKEFPNAKNTRFGTAFVDVEKDAKLVRIAINKPISGVARKLVKTLKGTGYTKVELVLDDGSPIESFTDQEEGQTTAAPAGAPGAPPPPPGPAPNQTPPQDPAVLARTLADLIKRIPQVVAVTPALKDQLSKLATDANVNLKTSNLVYAATYIASLRTALDNAPQGPAGPAATTAAPATPAPKAPEGAKVTYAKSRLAWLAARKKVEGDIEKLRAELIATFEDEGDGPELDKLYRARVAPVLEALDESLADKLDEAINAVDPAKHKALVDEAKGIIQRYTAYVASEQLIADLDENPIVPVAIRATLSATLSTLAKTIV